MTNAHQVEKFLRNAHKPGVQVEFELTEEGYAALSMIAERMARRPSLAAFTIGDALTLVFQVGTEAVMARMNAQTTEN